MVEILVGKVKKFEIFLINMLSCAGVVNSEGRMLSYWLNIYKPKGISSAAVVGIVKRALGGVKVGHCGTLDVEAEGILPLAVNEATKLVQVLVNAKKNYVFTVQFGAQTDSGDYSGKVINTTNLLPSRQEAFDVCQKFIGTITQIPPALSAIKINGARAYKLARDGKNPKLPPRDVEIYNLQCLNFDALSKQATYQAECSKGTYIRSLAEDIALSLQSLAFVIELRRTRVGVFGEEEAIVIPHHETPENAVIKSILEEKAIRIETVLDDILVLNANLEQAKKIKYGQECYFDQVEDASFMWVRYEGALLAIGALSKNCFDSFRVFNLTKII